MAPAEQESRKAPAQEFACEACGETFQSQEALEKHQEECAETANPER